MINQETDKDNMNKSNIIGEGSSSDHHRLISIESVNA